MKAQTTAVVTAISVAIILAVSGIILNSVKINMASLSTAASNATIDAGASALQLGNILPLVVIAGAMITFLLGSFLYTQQQG